MNSIISSNISLSYAARCGYSHHEDKDAIHEDKDAIHEDKDPILKAYTGLAADYTQNMTL
ncbi:MAG: hypothetical protein ACE5OZ_12815 [Candidatus Heimdallarchaeota archaeon]